MTSVWAKVAVSVNWLPHLYATDHVPYIFKTDSGTDTACAPGIFLFWQTKLFRTEFPTVGDCSVIVPALLAYLQEENKYGTGKKRM